MADVQVRSVTLEVRSARLTKPLLKQFRKINTLPDSWLADPSTVGAGEARKLKPDHVVGWFHGSVLGEEYATYVILTSGKGDYYIAEKHWLRFQVEPKQIYIG